MQLDNLHGIFDSLTTEFGEQGELPHYLQVGYAMLCVENHGMVRRKIETQVFSSLRQQYLRTKGHDEDAAMRHEHPANVKTLADYRNQFENVVAYVRGQLDGDGYYVFTHPAFGRTATKRPQLIADYLSSQNPFVLEQHVREAQARVGKRKAA